MTDTARRTAQNATAKQRSVVNCNFRSAGRLSNENARSLTSIHETFARHLASSLDAQLGTGLEVKLAGLEQLPIKEHIAAIPALTYIVPFSLSTIPGAAVVECDISLVFPIVDLLLGGAGGPGGGPRELSEIEEEIMQDVVALIVRQAEKAWRLPDMPLSPNRRVKSTVLHQYCPPNEKVTCVKFEVDIAGTIGGFQLVFPAAFVNILIQQIKLDQPQKKSSVRFFPRPSIRERILDCDVEVSAELQGLRVAVRDLLALVPGSVLKLRAPVRTPGMLTAGGQGIFEATPVRNGAQKAAQLGRRLSSTNWERV
ncbi:MAG TPA: FliM/FliN family flagellar motor switch protein [Terracidiphilus sp.]|jgi:flagellar motor switch protein FliM|nr:FliM/FliN family flagellar motor switch protein [Terracidiphilus sp.]